MFRVRIGLLAVLAFLLPPGAVRAQGHIQAGVLTCKGGEGVGLIVGSKKAYQCIFKHANGQADEPYAATVTRVGLDIGITGQTTMSWLVLSAAPELQTGALRGTYAGASAGAAAGIGGGANLLVGGSAKSVTLQPLSVQGETGLNLAVGIAAMTLE